MEMWKHLKSFQELGAFPHPHRNPHGRGLAAYRAKGLATLQAMEMHVAGQNHGE
jgi:hypothetical protein